MKIILVVTNPEAIALIRADNMRIAHTEGCMIATQHFGSMAELELFKKALKEQGAFQPEIEHAANNP